MSGTERVPAEEARKVAEQLIYHLAPVREHITIAGSLRRGKPDVGDIELVAMTSPAKKSRWHCSDFRPMGEKSSCLHFMTY